MKKYWITQWKSNGYYQVPYETIVEAETDKEAFEKALGRFSPNWEIDKTYLYDTFMHKAIARIERIDVKGKCLMMARYIGG